MKNQNLKNIKQTGFKTPKGYFENLEESLLNASELNIGIEENGFKVPENYFEGLEDIILKTVTNKNDTKVISLFTKKTVITSLSIAASILLLFNLSIFNKEVTLDSIDNDALESFVINEEYESSVIAGLITNDSDLLNSFFEESLSDTYLENYLLNSEDFEDLLSE